MGDPPDDRSATHRPEASNTGNGRRRRRRYHLREMLARRLAERPELRDATLADTVTPLNRLRSMPILPLTLRPAVSIAASVNIEVRMSGSDSRKVCLATMPTLSAPRRRAQ